MNLYFPWQAHIHFMKSLNDLMAPYCDLTIYILFMARFKMIGAPTEFIFVILIYCFPYLQNMISALIHIRVTNVVITHTRQHVRRLGDTQTHCQLFFVKRLSLFQIVYWYSEDIIQNGGRDPSCDLGAPYDRESIKYLLSATDMTKYW